MRRPVRAILGAGLVVTAIGTAPVAAHHGWSSYDSTKELTLSGSIKEAGYEHPHGHVRLSVPGKTWLVVLAPPTRLERRGLPASMLKVGTAATVDLRLLGLSRQLSVSGMERHLLRWARASLLVVVPTGSLMFVAHASEFFYNPAFRLKLMLLVAAGLNAWLFHLRPFRLVSEWDAGARAPLAARFAGGLSLVLGASVIACGRLPAHF